MAYTISAGAQYAAGSHPNAPAQSSSTVTPSDVTILNTTRALWIGTGGTLVVLLAGDNTAQTFINVASGAIMPLQCVQVLAATTAQSIVALY